MGERVRRARIVLFYDNQEIRNSAMQYLKSFEYTNYADNKHSDSISVKFEDSEGLWQSGWFPDRGAELEAAIKTQNWPGTQELKCGKFEIDDLGFTGPPNECNICGLSVGIKSSFRRQKNYKGWEAVTVEQVAREVAGKHGFQLEFTSTDTMVIDRFDQHEQSDMELLTVLCDQQGLGLQVIDKKIRIYDAVEAEAAAPAVTFTRNQDDYIRHDLRVGSAGVYQGVQLHYLDPKTAMPIRYIWMAEGGKWSGAGSELKIPSGHILMLKEQCKTEAEAEKIAKSKLRDKNNREALGTFTVLGNPTIKAGQTATVSGFGRFDGGQFIIKQVRHSYDKQSGYTTTVEFRGGLGY